MRVYTGDLIGGPDHGNTVSVSVPRIKAKVTTELWLDGEDKPSSTIYETGSYRWMYHSKFFKWHTESVEFQSKKRMLQVA